MPISRLDDCRSGPVKFDEKSKMDNSIRNHDDEVLINLGLIRSFFDGQLTCSMIVQELKIFAGLDL